MIEVRRTSPRCSVLDTQASIPNTRARRRRRARAVRRTGSAGAARTCAGARRLAFAMIGEATGSARLGRVPRSGRRTALYFPPAHALVYLSGLASAAGPGPRRPSAPQPGRGHLGALGLGVPPARRRARRRPAALRLPLAVAVARRLCRRLPRRRGPRALRDVDWGLALGARAPRARDPGGNPPSGVASGYVWFDVMAMLVARGSYHSAARRWSPPSTAENG